MSELESFTYTLPSGAEVEIENIQEKRFGTEDVAPKGKQKLPLSQVISPLGEVVDMLFESVKSHVKAPDIITLELGASLKGQTKLVIVSGEGTANIKVTLTWNKSG
jgi:hypothetical protein